MNTTNVPDFDITPVNFLNACDINRACNPTCASPISPSISARGVNAATLSTTTTSTAPDRTNNSTISNACSPVSGCDTNNSSVSTPNARAYDGSNACSASTNAAPPPARCASATICNANVVFPPDSGPYTSTTRPRGTPPTPNATSTDNDPVEITPADNTPTGSAPRRITAPRPN